MKSKIAINLTIRLLAAIASLTGSLAPVLGQSPQYDDFFQVQNLPPQSPFPNRSQLGGAQPVQYQTPPAVLGQPDIIYTSPPNYGNPGAFQQQPIPSQSTPFPSFPYQPQDPFGSGIQPIQPPGTPYWNNPPNYEGTNSNWLPNIDWNRFHQDYVLRVFERPRARQTYIYGRSKEQQLGINDIELATTLTFANFLGTSQPLRTSPGFIFHYWNGPNTVANPGFDLPPRAYSIFVSFDHLTNPANQIGLENSFTVGYYSDFENHSSDGIRLTGRALAWSRLNSYTIGKLGVEYFDRVHVKMLPAFGVYMTPTPDLKLDLLFPKSKLSHRIPNLNDTEAWIYVGAEYGGGSWVIERMGGMDDQVDINDVRSYLGVEWMGPRRVTGFFEVGYVFNREIRYRSDPLNELEISDSIMIRSGFAF